MKKTRRSFLGLIGAGMASMGILHITASDAHAMQEYEELKVLVAEIEADIAKAEGGNKAAGTRVRKQMQKVKQAAQRVRNRVIELTKVS